MTSRLAPIADPTRRDSAMLAHAKHRGEVILATGDRARLVCWSATKARVLIRGVRHVSPVADVWPLCACGQPCHQPSLDAGHRICADCIDTARHHAISDPMKDHT